MKPSDPLLLADVIYRCGMYPAGKVDISGHLAIPGFPQSDHTVGKPSAKMSASHLLICLDYRTRNRPHLTSS